MSLKDDIKKWGQPWTDMMRVAHEREPRLVLVADCGASEALLSHAMALHEIGRGIAVHVSRLDNEQPIVLNHCISWIKREQLHRSVSFVFGDYSSVVRMIGGCDMLCLNADSPHFDLDVIHYVPMIHQNGAIWVTGVTNETDLIVELKNQCKLSINDVAQKFRLFIKKNWTP